MISVITPVKDCPELAAQYIKAVRGCEVIIVDNASDEAAARVWKDAARGLEGVYLRNDTNQWYASACNQGYAVSTGDVVVFLNNDILLRGDWLSPLSRIPAGALYGPALNTRVLAGQPLIYIDAWWIAARRETWEMLRPIGKFADYEGISEFMQPGPWDGLAFQGMYWDDVDLCWRATRAGLALRTLPLPLAHLSNYTSQRTDGAYAHTDSNGGDGTHRAIVEARVREAL